MHLLADKAFVCEIPTVEVTVAIRFVWVDVLHGGLGEGCNRVERTSSGPGVGVGVGGAVGKGGQRQRGIGRSRNRIAIVGAFLSLPATFAFVVFAFSFPLSLAFAFDVKRVVTTRGGFSRHIPVLIQERDIDGERQGYVG